MMKEIRKESDMGLVEKLKAIDERNENGGWVPASGGTEQPFVASGRRVQYLWQPSTGRHAYIDCGTDIMLSDDEAWKFFG